MRPVTFDGIFGWLHPAAGKRGVVLCSPHGFEEICVHRMWRALAEHLATAGMPTLRFDYQGTGDSAGSDEDPARVRSWLDSVHAAARWLRRETGVEEVALVGLRLGGLLAAVAAEESGEIDAVALLATPASGRAYIREMRALARMGASLNGEMPSRPEWAGDIESAGFVYTAETLAALEGLDLLKLERRPAPRVLLLDRPDMPGDGRVGARLAALGAAVEVQPFAGYADFLRDGQFARFPEATFAAMGAWLAQDAGQGSALREPSGPARLDLAEAVEEAVYFGPGQAFGVHARPKAPRAGAPGVIFLNTGSNHHVGANRFAVTLARQLAASGIGSLRMDIAGVGDSPSKPDFPDNTLYDRRSCADIRAALDWFAGQGHARCILVGVCSGGYLGFHTALEDERVAGLVLVNTQRFVWAEGETMDLVIYKSAKTTGFYFKALLRPAQWKRAFKGEVQFAGRALGIAERLCKRGLAVAKEWRTRLLAGEEHDEVARWFGELCRRGVDLLVVYNAEDGGVAEFEQRLGRGGWKLKPWPNARLAMLPGYDHNFAARWSRLCFSELLADYVEAHCAQQATAKSPPSLAAATVHPPVRAEKAA